MLLNSWIPETPRLTWSFTTSIVQITSLACLKSSHFSHLSGSTWRNPSGRVISPNNAAAIQLDKTVKLISQETFEGECSLICMRWNRFMRSHITRYQHLYWWTELSVNKANPISDYGRLHVCLVRSRDVTLENARVDGCGVKQGLEQWKRYSIPHVTLSSNGDVHQGCTIL